MLAETAISFKFLGVALCVFSVLIVLGIHWFKADKKQAEIYRAANRQMEKHLETAFQIKTRDELKIFWNETWIPFRKKNESYCKASSINEIEAYVLGKNDGFRIKEGLEPTTVLAK